MGIKEGLLALLATGPKHGYQLKVELEAATGNGMVVNVGQVYTTLQRLERDGLVGSGGETDDSRVVYTITPSGRGELKAWGDRPESLAAGRDELSIKVLLSIYTNVLDPAEVIATQRSETMGQLQDYTSLKLADSGDDLAWQLHLDRLIFNAEAELKWLDRVEQRLPGVTPQLPEPAIAELMEEAER